MLLNGKLDVSEQKIILFQDLRLHSSFFHNSPLIRRVEQEKNYQKRFDQELNPGHLLSNQAL